MKLVYWDCRGRAQPIRDFLIDREIAFTDDQIPGEDIPTAWPALKADASRSGPFGTLPLLFHEDRVIAESDVIIRYLQDLDDLASWTSRPARLSGKVDEGEFLEEIRSTDLAACWH